jgi:hypothetical protein
MYHLFRSNNQISVNVSYHMKISNFPADLKRKSPSTVASTSLGLVNLLELFALAGLRLKAQRFHLYMLACHTRMQGLRQRSRHFLVLCRQ